MTDTKRPSLVILGAAVILTLQAACVQSTGQRRPSSDLISASVPVAPPRTIGVTASPDIEFTGQTITPHYRAFQSRSLEAARNGFERGAGKTIEAFMILLGPVGIFAGFMAYPPGAVIGAGLGVIGAETAFANYSLAHLKGGLRLQDLIRGERPIEEQIRDEIVTYGNKKTVHRLAALAHEQFSYERVSYLPNSNVRGELAILGFAEIIDIHVSDFAFVGREGPDPRIGLKIELRALCYLEGRPMVTRTATYEGQRRTASAWAEHDGRLLRAELRSAARDLATEIAMNHLHIGAAATRLASLGSGKNISGLNERTFVYLNPNP